MKAIDGIMATYRQTHTLTEEQAQTVRDDVSNGRIPSRKRSGK
jgi:hypothetical protein